MHTSGRLQGSHAPPWASRRTRQRAIVVLAAAMVALPASAQVYRCNEGGRTIYSDKPCADPDRTVTVPVTPSAAARDAPDPNLQREASLERVAVGMTPAQVETAWGKPKSVNTTTSANGRTEQWVYRRGSGNQYVHFRAGRVSSINEYSSEEAATRPDAQPAPMITTAEREAAMRAERAQERKHVTDGTASTTVEGRLGPPERKGWTGGSEWWTYGPTDRDSQTRTTIWFRGGRVVKVDRVVER